VVKKLKSSEQNEVNHVVALALAVQILGLLQVDYCAALQKDLNASQRDLVEYWMELV